MSDTPKFQLPIDIPACPCFDVADPNYAMGRCADVSKCAATMVQAMLELAKMEELCKHALPYVVEMFVISALCSISKINGPALEYGSKEMEWETERLLQGMEARVLARSRDVYARGRELGLTEEVAKAMYERDQKGSQS